MRDVVGVKISSGQCRKLVAKVTDSLAEPYDELLTLLASQDQLNVDETGHKDNGKRLWTPRFVSLGLVRRLLLVLAESTFGL